MTMTQRSRSRHTPEDHAQAFAVVLRKEFGVPFSLYDAITGQPIEAEAGDGHKGTDLSAPRRRTPAEVRLQADEGRPRVEPLAPPRYEFSLVLYHGGRPAFVATGVYRGFAPSPADIEREATGLRHWLQSFADRLRLSDQFACQHGAVEDQAAQSRLAWEGLLSLDQLLRRLRIHKDPTRNQQRVLETAHGLLGAQTLICVPPDPQLPVIVHGEPLLAALDCVQLAGLLAKTSGYSGGPLLCSQSETHPWARAFPSISTLLAIPIGEPPAPGWLIALNKGLKDNRTAQPFRKSDAALLTPFVALLWHHHHASARYQDLKELMVGLARSLTAAIDAKDSYTFGHSERVARIAVELARTMGMDGDAQSDLYLAGLLHDVGKIGVPDAILRKPGRLTDEEFDLVKQHVTIGHTILSDLRPIRHLLCGVLYHHERFDGRGYPEGLAGEAIPLLARVLAVADSYDAMSTSRPYRTAMTVKDVEEQLRQGAGKQWDAQIVEAFWRCRQKIHAIRQRGVGESLRQALDGALRSQCHEPSTRVF
jgi:HD-GYP domain-containing protein (c-di-GMP phosphodiesterase class II)